MKRSYFIKMSPTNTAVAANAGTIFLNRVSWMVSFIGSARSAVKRKSFNRKRETGFNPISLFLFICSSYE
ncbi:hypothetical protein HF072_14800 [Bacillus sp. RO3]|nr:hypothetical protein [Bacillus sp. RO3]